MSGSHLSKDLYELIKAIGDARSKQEEDKIIGTETHQLMERFKSKSIRDRQMKEYLISSIYVELLGHNASFAHIPAINSAQSESLKLKRLSYLACTLFLTEKSNAQILLVATLQKDLASNIDQKVGAALTTLCKVINNSILEAVKEPVYKLLSHKNSWIKKKAVMVAHRFYVLNPSLIDDLDPKMKTALCDKDPCVMAASLNYFHTVIKENPNRYKDLVPSLVVILKQVIEHRLPKEYDFHRMPAPWIQMELLAILGFLGQYDQGASEGMYEVLGMAMKRADDLGINIGYAIVYQCLKTIITIYPYKNLIELAATTISRFLSTDNKNLKYVGITGLSLIVSVNPDYVLQHQNSIVECLEDPDETLKAKSIDLLYKMTNYKNVNAIVEKFLNYLRSAPTDSPIRKDLVYKINQLAERFATNKTWFINTVNRLFEISGDLITADITNSFIKLILDWEEDAEAATFRNYAINLYLGILKTSAVVSDPLMEVMSFIIGFYGPMVITDSNVLIEVIKCLCKWTEYSFNNERTKGLILNAIMKLHRAINYHKLAEIDSLLEKFSRSRNTELAQRALEHLHFISKPELDVAKLLQPVEEPDENLSFLSRYAERVGGEKYDESKSLVGMKSSEPGLKFGPYNEPNKYLPRRTEGVFRTGQANVDTVLTVNVPRVIGETGYVGKIPGTTVATNVPKGKKPIETISFTHNEFPQTEKQMEVTKEKAGKKQKKEELVKAGSDVFKSDIFSGIGEMAGTTLFEDKPVPSVIPSSQPAAPANIPKPVDLLGFDLEETKEKGKTEEVVSLEGDFGILMPKKQQTLVSPLGIETEEFGEKWVSYQLTQTETIANTKNLSTKDVAQRINNLGFHSVSLLESEGILAGTLGDCILILHYMLANSNITFTLKTSKLITQTAQILRSIVSTAN